MNSHGTKIIEDRLSVSYEEAQCWIDEDDAANSEIYPALAVLLTTKCCELNHDHISLEKEEAQVLGQWLIAFANGEYDE